MNKKIKNFVLLTVFISMMAIPFISMASAVPDTSSHNDIDIDGVIGTDWTDGNYTVRLDPDLTGWGPDWQLDGLYFALNDNGIAVGLNGRRSGLYGNYFDVFIDTDQGGAGLMDFNLATTFPGNKKLTFTSDGFIPDFVLHSPGSAATMPEDLWELWQFTDDLGSVTDLSATSGYVAATENVSYDITYEAFIPWVAIYPSGIPADAELRLFAAMIGGEPGDVIPNQYLDVDSANIEYSNYVEVQVADFDGDPQLLPYTIGWPGANALPDVYTTAEINDDGAGNVLLNLDMVITYQLWWDGSNHDYMNSSDWPILYYTYWNETAGANDTEVSVQMFHQAGYTYMDNEIYNYVIPLMSSEGYSVDDKFYWHILAGDLLEADVTEFVHTIIPIPPIDIGFVGNIQPSGGVLNPDEDFDITVHIEQLWDGSNPIAFDVGTVVILNYDIDDTDVWDTIPMMWNSEQGLNAEYIVTIPGLPEFSTFTFNFNVTNNNTVITPYYTVLFVIPPPEDEIFYMTDPKHDEWGTYQTNAAFGGFTEGLFDILEFNVSANLYGTTFAFRLANSFDPGWGAGNFSHQMFVVYVDSETGGSTESVLRSYANIEETHAWDHAFYGDGWLQRYITPATITDPMTSGHEMNSWYDFVDNEHWFYIHVPETLFGEVADSTWNYVAMSSSADFNDFRSHMEMNGEWYFGGGDDSDIDPNYCDILIPPGGDSALVQEIISSSYDVPNATQVIIPAVGHGLTLIPTITSPDDITYDYGETGQSLSWTVTATIFNENATYSISVDGTEDTTGSWISGDIITYDISEWDIGEYEVFIIIDDGFGGSTSDTVIIAVINGDPIITSPDDVTYDTSDNLVAGFSIDWIVTDNSVNNPTYSITVDGVEEDTGTWTSGTRISFDIPDWKVGDYEVVLTVDDGLGGSASDTVIISVTGSVFNISGYTTRFLLIALIGTAAILFKKRK